MVHGVEELVFVDEAAEEEVEQAEEEDEPAAGQDGVDDADDVDEDRLGEVEAVGEDGRLAIGGDVTGRLVGARVVVEWVESDGAEFQQAEGEQAQALEDDEVHVEQYQVLETGGEHVGDVGGVFEGFPDLGAGGVDLVGGVGDGAEDGEDDEEIEEGEEEVFADERHFHVALGGHPLVSREPCKLSYFSKGGLMGSWVPARLSRLKEGVGEEHTVVEIGNSYAQDGEQESWNTSLDQCSTDLMACQGVFQLGRHLANVL